MERVSGHEDNARGRDLSRRRCYHRYIDSIHRPTRSTRKAGSGLLELAVLGLLKEQSLHGYELRRRLGEMLGPVGRLSFGTLYPALNRLETDGAVTVVKVSESRTGLTTARGRKVYALTAAGEAHFDELLLTSAGSDDDKSFALRLAFARYLPSEGRLRLLMRRREHLTDRLAEARTALANRERDRDPYRRSLMEHASEVMQSDISWLERLIAKEQQPS